MPATLLEQAQKVLLQAPIRGEADTPTTTPGSPYVDTEPRTPEQQEAKTLKMVLERHEIAARFDLPFKQRALLHHM